MSAWNPQDGGEETLDGGEETNQEPATPKNTANTGRKCLSFGGEKKSNEPV